MECRQCHFSSHCLLAKTIPERECPTQRKSRLAAQQTVRNALTNHDVAAAEEFAVNVHLDTPFFAVSDRIRTLSPMRMLTALRSFTSCPSVNHRTAQQICRRGVLHPPEETSATAHAAIIKLRTPSCALRILLHGLASFQLPPPLPDLASPCQTVVPHLRVLLEPRAQRLVLQNVHAGELVRRHPQRMKDLCSDSAYGMLVKHSELPKHLQQHRIICSGSASAHRV